MLTLENLLKSSNYKLMRDLGKYKLDAYTTNSGNDDFGAYVRYLAEIIGGNDSRKATITAYNEKLDLSSPVIVYCSCDYFKYNLEIALAARGSAIQLHADGIMPKQRNAAFRPGLCQHLMLLAKSALNESKKITKTVKKAPKINPKLVGR